MELTLGLGFCLLRERIFRLFDFHVTGFLEEKPLHIRCETD
jgi:hypothetical protein